MATAGGPDIIEDGLVLALDAANTKSFRGEPTENLFATFSSNENNAVLVGVSPISLACGASGNWSRCNYGGGTFAYSHIETTNPYGVNSLVGNLVATVSGGDYRATISNIGATTLNRTFTFSIWIKNNGGSDTNLSMSIRTNGDANGITVGKSITNEWQRISITHTFTGTCTSEIRSYLFNVNAGTNILLYGAQLEEKSYPTRFVNGTRSTTVAAGGGWADISGNDNHGEILNGTSTSNDGSVLGALDFDGTNDYIDLGTQLNNLTVFTVEGVFKTDITGGADTFQVIFGAGPLNTSNYTNISIGNLTGSYPDESFHVVLKANTLQFYVRNGANFYFDQKYHHFVVNTEANKNAVYIDGVEQSLTYSQGSSAVDWGGINSLGASNVCAIGRRSYNGGNGYFNGNIPFIRVYNRSLTEKEILANYNSLKSRFGL